MSIGKGLLYVVALVLAGLLISLIWASTASAQERISASIETTASNTVTTSFDNPVTAGVVIHSQRWRPSQQAMRITASLPHQFTASIKFDIGGSIDDGPKSQDPRTGLWQNLRYLESYAGNSRSFDVSVAYKLKSYLSLTGGYMGYRLHEEMENFYQLSFNGSGYLDRFQRTETYHALQVGARSSFKLDRVELQPVFEYFPIVRREFTSHQQALGQTFDNHFPDMGQTDGYKIAGRLSYDLDNEGHFKGTFGYTYQVLTTHEGRVPIGNVQNEHLTLRGANFGLQVGF
jgi:hypothetical protein